MAKKELKWRGKTLEEAKKMDLKDFTLLLPARKKRALKRGFTEKQKKLLKKQRLLKKKPCLRALLFLYI